MQRAMHRLQHWLDQDARRTTILALLGLIGLSAIAFFNGVGGLGLMDKTEGLFVEVPRQMLLSGDWVTPRWNGEIFFDYPVWGYWMVGLSFRLFGISEGAARLPAALAATATVLALFAVLLLIAPADERPSRRIGRASLCATVLCLSPGWVGWGRSSVTDMFLASGITLALLGFVLAWCAADRPVLRRLGHGVLALFCGVAVLAKGPVGLLLPGLVIIGFLLLKRQLLPEVRRTPWPALLALFLGVTLPWYAAATAANGATFIGRFLGFSNLERFTSVLYSHPGPPWFYLPWVVVLLLPWSLFLPVAVSRLRLWRPVVWRGPAGPEDLPLLAAVWLVVIVAFFSAAATKLPGYILPAVPGGLLLVGLMFLPFASTSSEAPAPPALSVPPFGAGLRWSGAINALLLALAAVAAVLAPRWIGGDPAYPDFAAAIQASPLPLLLAIPLALGALVLLLQLLRARGGADAMAVSAALGRLWMPNAAAFAAVLALVVPVLTPLLDRERLLPIRQLARLAAQAARGDEPLVVVGYKRYSVVHYSGRPVLFVSSATGARRALSGRDTEHVPSAIRASTSVSILLLGSDAELLEFGVGPGDATLIGRRDSHQLLRLPVDRLRRIARQS
ncbi:MAG: ArnT family glycosyltransferase [Vulcanococcus sp.]